jgi:hypothetical protein
MGWKDVEILAEQEGAESLLWEGGDAPSHSSDRL